LKQSLCNTEEVVLDFILLQNSLITTLARGAFISFPWTSRPHEKKRTAAADRQRKIKPE
tara:strand:+ start:55 stop:231 length:177 start_codon:yes stop_codon:yes gene_type:complete